MNTHSAITTIFRTSLIAASLCAVSLPALAQSSGAEAEYAGVLASIENAQLNITQRQAYIATQEQTIASLNQQIKDSKGTIATIEPMFSKMVTAIEGEINKDIPFLSGIRFQRLDKLKTDVADATRSPGEKMRSALMIYDIEVGYGQSLEAYGGQSPISPGGRLTACEADINGANCNLEKGLTEKLEAGATLRDIRNEVFDGSYLRYGRLALAYQQFDGSVTMRYDASTKEWVELNSGQALEVERGLRTARGEAAPNVVNAPVYINN